MTSPSLRTMDVVATPTLAVCGATGLPTSAPAEFSAGNSSTGAPSSFPTVSWNAPNTAFDEVLLPDSATAIQPSTGDSTTKTGPILANPWAIELAMPE